MISRNGGCVISQFEKDGYVLISQFDAKRQYSNLPDVEMTKHNSLDNKLNVLGSLQGINVVEIHAIDKSDLSEIDDICCTLNANYNQYRHIIAVGVDFKSSEITLWSTKPDVELHYIRTMASFNYYNVRNQYIPAKNVWISLNPWCANSYRNIKIQESYKIKEVKKRFDKQIKELWAHIRTLEQALPESFTLDTLDSDFAEALEGLDIA